MTEPWAWTHCGRTCDPAVHENDAPVEVFQQFTGAGIIVSPHVGVA